VSAETAAAVRRRVGGGRRAACELVAEVAVGRGEVAAMCEGLRATGGSAAADCLATVDELLQLTGWTDFTTAAHGGADCDETPSSTSVNDHLPPE